MGKVKFKNGTEIETIAVYGSAMTFQNANRDTLEFRIAADEAEFDDLKAIYTNSEALSEIEVKDFTEKLSETGEVEEVEVSSLHLNYTLPVELRLDGAAVWCMKVAQKSALEIAQDKQAADINDTQLALMELADLISGGDENG